MATETDQILAEVRGIRRDFQELSLQIRVDTPWVRAKTHMRYALQFMREIPALTRFFLLLATVCLSVGLGFKLNEETRKRLLLSSLNLAMLAVTVINYG